MRDSLTPGKLLPESEEDFFLLRGSRQFTSCSDCAAPFSSLNTHTAAGWRETQISGLCEDCFDELFGDDEPGDEPERGDQQ